MTDLYIYFNFKITQNQVLMEFLKQYLDSDTLGIVCEFLIKGNDYAPFTLEDIKHLESRIYDWNRCMQWAARESNLPILKYAGENPTISKMNWERCAEAAASCGKTDAFKYCALRAFHYGWASWQIGMFCAIEHGHSHLARYASNHFSVRGWGECLLTSASRGNIDLVKYFEIKYLQSNPDPPPWDECFSIAQQKNDKKIMDYSREKLAQHARKIVGC